MTALKRLTALLSLLIVCPANYAAAEANAPDATMLSYSELMHLQPQKQREYILALRDMLAEVADENERTGGRFLGNQDLKVTPIEALVGLFAGGDAALADADTTSARRCGNGYKGVYLKSNSDDRNSDIYACEIAYGDCPSDHVTLSYSGGQGCFPPEYAKAILAASPAQKQQFQPAPINKTEADKVAKLDAAGGKAQCIAQKKNNANWSTAIKKYRATAGTKCVYAGFYKAGPSTTGPGNPNEPVPGCKSQDSETYGDYKVSCGDGAKKALCNPLLFGVQKEADDGKSAVGICVAKGPNVTRACNQAAPSKGNNGVQAKADTNFWQKNLSSIQSKWDEFSKGVTDLCNDQNFRPVHCTECTIIKQRLANARGAAGQTSGKDNLSTPSGAGQLIK